MGLEKPVTRRQTLPFQHPLTNQEFEPHAGRRWLLRAMRTELSSNGMDTPLRDLLESDEQCVSGS